MFLLWYWTTSRQWDVITWLGVAVVMGTQYSFKLPGYDSDLIKSGFASVLLEMSLNINQTIILGILDGDSFFFLDWHTVTSKECLSRRCNSKPLLLFDVSDHWAFFSYFSEIDRDRQTGRQAVFEEGPVARNIISEPLRLRVATGERRYFNLYGPSKSYANFGMVSLPSKWDISGTTSAITTINTSLEMSSQCAFDCKNAAKNLFKYWDTGQNAPRVGLSTLEGKMKSFLVSEAATKNVRSRNRFIWDRAFRKQKNVRLSNLKTCHRVVWVLRGTD